MIYMYIVVSIDNVNVQQENKRIKWPLRAKPTQNPLENQKPSYQKGKKTSENWVFRHFGHDKIIFFKFFFDEYSYNTLYPQHCTDKKTVWKHFLVMKFSSAAPSKRSTCTPTSATIINERKQIVRRRIHNNSPQKRRSYNT